MGCTISKKTFNINLNGTNTTHKFVIHSTSNGNNHVLQFTNNGQSIRWRESSGATHDKFPVISFGSVVIPIEFTDINETVKLWYWPGGFFWKPPNRIRLYLDDIDSQDNTHISERTSTEHCCKQFCPSYLTLLGIMALFIIIGVFSKAYFLIYLSMVPIFVLIFIPCCIGNETYGAQNVINTQATPSNRPYQHPTVKLLAGNTIPTLPVKPMSNRTPNVYAPPAQSQPQQLKQQLPNGWIQLYANDGRVYYQNQTTQKTQWEFPTVNNKKLSGYQAVKQNIEPSTPSEVVVVVQRKEDNNLPNNWSVSVTPDGKTLYVNDISGKTQWERPVDNYQDKKNVNEVYENKSKKLPPNWVECKTDDGRVYYQNNNDKSTYWELPPEYK